MATTNQNNGNNAIVWVIVVALLAGLVWAFATGKFTMSKEAQEDVNTIEQNIDETATDIADGTEEVVNDVVDAGEEFAADVQSGAEEVIEDMSGAVN